MGLFKSEEEKQQAKAENAQKILREYGLEALTGKDAEVMQMLATQTTGASLMSLGATLAGPDPATKASAAELDIIIQQNYMIIRKLCEISEKLK